MVEILTFLMLSFLSHYLLVSHVIISLFTKLLLSDHFSIRLSLVSMWQSPVFVNCHHSTYLQNVLHLTSDLPNLICIWPVKYYGMNYFPPYFSKIRYRLYIKEVKEKVLTWKHISGCPKNVCFFLAPKVAWTQRKKSINVFAFQYYAGLSLLCQAFMLDSIHSIPSVGAIRTISNYSAYK